MRPGEGGRRQQIRCRPPFDGTDIEPICHINRSIEWGKDAFNAWSDPCDGRLKVLTCVHDEAVASPHLVGTHTIGGRDLYLDWPIIVRELIENRL